ncbi:MAG: restriction endonuclease subunit S [Chlamydiae bacterium]|nr:restriction endonuclease subunit S [Chlamydiota bacterium]
MTRLVRGSAQPFISYDLLNNVDIFLPDINSQGKIASILSAYDDLIENNEKRIKALEEMAQLLYTEWFVKFKFPGHEKVKMVDSKTEYGLIPEGWAIGKLGNIAKIISGYAFKSSDFQKTGILVIKIKNIEFVDQLFESLVALAKDLNEEERRAVKESLSEDELAIFDLLVKENLNPNEVAQIKGAAHELLLNLKPLLVSHWRDFETNRAGVKVTIFDLLLDKLPEPTYTEQDCKLKGVEVYNFVYEHYWDAQSLACA